MSERQLSLASIFVAIAFVAAGLALLRITPPLSMFFLVGLFITCMAPGVVYGYTQNKTAGAVQWGCASGTPARRGMKCRLIPMIINPAQPTSCTWPWS